MTESAADLTERIHEILLQRESISPAQFVSEVVEAFRQAGWDLQ